MCIHIIRFLLQTNEKGEAKVISLKLLTKSPRFREVLGEAAEVVTVTANKKKSESSV